MKPEHRLLKLMSKEDREYYEKNLRLACTGKSPQPERDVGDGALGKKKAKKKNPERFFVIITSVRKRLLDIDNLFGGCKPWVDCLRYGGIISEDTPEALDLKVHQRKCEKDEAEHTRIEVYQI